MLRITKDTVYKNLNVLAEEGFIREVNVKGVSRFEAKIEAHHHLICKFCGRIADFNSKELIDFALRLIQYQEDFKISTEETNFYGLCIECKS